MAFVEYILVALLGSIGAVPAGTPRSPETRTLDSEVIAQPCGGAAVEGHFSIVNGIISQATSGSPGKQSTGKKPVHHTSARRHHRTGGKSGGNTNAPLKGKKGNVK